MAAPGHTVGHTIFMITSDGKTLAAIGDLTHHQVLLVEKPRIEFAYDTDPKQSANTRVKVLDMLAANRIPLLAYHFPWPGVGHVAKQGDGFRYHPTPLQMVAGSEGLSRLEPYGKASAGALSFLVAVRVSGRQKRAMLKVRIIPCLDVKDGRVVKGVNFVDLIDAGDPVEAAAAYDARRRRRAVLPRHHGQPREPRHHSSTSSSAPPRAASCR